MILLFSPVLESPFSSWLISWSVFPRHRHGYMTKIWLKYVGAARHTVPWSSFG